MAGSKVAGLAREIMACKNEGGNPEPFDLI